jgi:hypothetical protein
MKMFQHVTAYPGVFTVHSVLQTFMVIQWSWNVFCHILFNDIQEYRALFAH